MDDTFLERIVAATRRTLADRVARTPLDVLRDRIATAPTPRAFAPALKPPHGGHARLVAEVKRASPSKSLLAADFDPAARARAYAAGGAAVISVLTEPEFFLGSLDHLAAVRAAVDLPILRKDFILDPYQIYEARAAGADAILLICALLDDPALRDLLDLTHALGMEALVEAHDAAEVHRAVAVGARVIGVNSRDLRTFAVDPDIVPHLRPLVPAGRVFVAESGIATPADALHTRAWGADAILVGEALMRAADPTSLARALATAGGGPTAALFAARPAPFVKLCGLREPAHARVAATAGADAFGLIFAPVRRQVTPATAAAIVRAAREACSPARHGDVRAHGMRPAGEKEPSPPLRPSATSATSAVLVSPLRPSASSVSSLCVLPPFAVGVFVDEAPATIARIAHDVGLDAIQLSGHEPCKVIAAVASLTGLPILKAVRVSTAEDFAAVEAAVERAIAVGATPLLEPRAPAADAPNSRYGGNGRTGDWDLARQVAARWPVILAGGLTPANVAAALAAVHPRGVDVSSGTETDGVKDEAKLRAFVAAARGARPIPN